MVDMTLAVAGVALALGVLWLAVSKKKKRDCRCGRRDCNGKCGDRGDRGDRSGRREQECGCGRRDCNGKCGRGGDRARDDRDDRGDSSSSSAACAQLASVTLLSRTLAPTVSVNDTEDNALGVFDYVALSSSFNTMTTPIVASAALWPMSSRSLRTDGGVLAPSIPAGSKMADGVRFTARRGRTSVLQVSSAATLFPGAGAVGVPAGQILFVPHDSPSAPVIVSNYIMRPLATLVEVKGEDDALHTVLEANGLYSAAASPVNYRTSVSGTLVAVFGFAGTYTGDDSPTAILIGASALTVTEVSANDLNLDSQLHNSGRRHGSSRRWETCSNASGASSASRASRASSASSSSSASSGSAASRGGGLSSVPATSGSAVAR